MMSDKPLAHAAGTNVAPHQLAKLFLEFGPLVVFFLANSYRGIFWGTGVFMVATVIALAASRTILGRTPIMPLVSGFCVVVFGALTLLLQDATFIKMKPTIVNLFFATMLFGAWLLGRPLLQYLMGDFLKLSQAGWGKLTFRWACFFVCLAALNEIVWRNFSESAWVAFKIWGIVPLTMAFAIAQIGVLKRFEVSQGKPS
jgi:intracellular septation protein